MNTKFESDPSLLDAAVEVMRFAGMWKDMGTWNTLFFFAKQ